MTNRKIISEGMRAGDLADLVIPLLSVDEWESKVDPKEAIVIGFYVHDQGAASDLNRFLQKSAAPLLDTDVSPAPDQHGYFMVFVELLNNERVAENVADILKEISPLVDIDEWNMRVRKIKDLLPFTEQNFENALERNKKMDEHATILGFLETSALQNATIRDNLLIMEGSGERHVFEIVGIGRPSELFEQYLLNEAPINYTPRAIARSNRILRMLGESWNVSVIGKNQLLLQNDGDPRALLLSP